MAQSQIYSKRAQIFVKEEATQDTYQTQAAGDAFMATDFSYSLDSTNWSPEYLRGDFLSGDEVPGSAAATMTFSVPAKGSGDPGDITIEFEEALKACGLEVANSVGVSDVYSPTSVFDSAGGNPHGSYSISALVDGVRYAVKGSFGNLTFEGNVDQPGIFTFTFQGAYQAVIDDALESPTYQTTIAPAYRGSDLALNIGGAYTEKGIESFSFDLGNVITLGRDVQDTVGIYGARIVGRRTTVTFTPEMSLVATQDPFGDWLAGTASTSFTSGVIGSTAGNKYSFSMPRVVLRPPEVSDRNGIQALTLTGAVSSAATDVEGTAKDFTITFN